MATRTVKSTNLYTTPFCKDYWRDAAAELKDIKMLVITALMIALRVALKPLAIPLGPQLSIQTAMLATALGAMIFGPVVAIPAAIISDTIGFMIFPTGDYFLPFVLTEIASTMFYALFLYRAKLSATRVVLARFCICFFVNVVLQQVIFAWQYTYMGNPDKAKEQILGIMTVARIFKNLCMFPIESVVLTLFLGILVPITKRMRLTYDQKANLKFSKKQIIALVLLVVVGVGSAIGYLVYRYDNNSRSADYTTEERIEYNQKMQEIILEQSDDWDNMTTVSIVDSAYREFLGTQTTYTVSLYEVKEGVEVTNDLWQLSKSKAAKHESLSKVATITILLNEKTGEVLSYTTEAVK